MCYAAQVVRPGQEYIDALTPTAAGRTRTLKWLPLGPGFACDGQLTVQECGPAPDRKYLLMECVTGGGFDGRGFVLRKPGGSAGHEVFLGRDGHTTTCSCEWGTYKAHVRPCVHVEAVLLIVRNGWLEMTPAAAGPDPTDAPF